MTHEHSRQKQDPPIRRHPAEGAALPESGASLWKLTAGPTVWAVHFLACYITVAIWCAKAARIAAPLGGVRTWLWIYTAVALFAIVLFGWRGWRQHRWGTAALPHDEASHGDRHRFLGFATLLLCGLSFVAVLYAAMAIAIFGTCR